MTRIIFTLEAAVDPDPGVVDWTVCKSNGGSNNEYVCESLS